MDPELDSLIDENNLGHKKEVFIQMGIKTFKQMAQIKTSDLKEDHLFNYADERAFQTFREICIQKVEENKTKQRTSSTASAPQDQIFSELGNTRIQNPQQSLNYPAKIDPVPPLLGQSVSLPNNPTHPQYLYSPPHTFHQTNPAFCPIAPNDSFSSFQQTLQPYSMVPDQHYYPPQPHSYRAELRPHIGSPRHGHPSMSIDLMQNTGEPVIRFCDYQINPGHTPRGIGLVFTNEIFVNHPRRDGAKNDENNFASFFQMMGLDVYKYTDYKSEGILDILAQFSRRDLSNAEMFAVAFSTHGDQGDLLYGSDNTTFSLYKQVINLFRINKCPALKGKPKLFFIQACRGDKTDATALPGGIQADSAERASVTLETDFLVAHSSVEGYKAFRHEREGSWFVTQLKRAFGMFGDECSMLEVLSLTNQLVVEKSIMSSGATDKYIQTCQFESTLTKLLKIKPIRPM